MPQAPRVRRMQDARKRGLSAAQIAVKEQVSLATVYRAISGKAFQKSLAVQLTKLNLRRVNTSGKIDGILEKLSTELDRRVSNSEQIKKLKFNPKDMADLAKVSHLQYEQGTAHLKEQILAGQQQMDKELERDAKILDLDVTPEKPDGPPE
jgi:hypothetical protein